MGEEQTDLNALTDIIDRPKSFNAHARRSSLVLNLQDARRPMHNVLLYDESVMEEVKGNREIMTDSSNDSDSSSQQNSLFSNAMENIDPEEIFIRF